MNGSLIILLPHTRHHAAEMMREAPDGHSLIIRPPSATTAQKRRFHWLCNLAAQSDMTFANQRQTAKRWKLLFLSAHAAAVMHEEPEITSGLENEPVSMREHTSDMLKARMASLIEYVTVYLTDHGVPVPERGIEVPGWYREPA